MSSDKMEKLIEDFAKFNTTEDEYKRDSKKEIEDNKFKLSSIYSQAAKNGYKEEELVCKDLNTKLIKEEFRPILGNNYNECNRIKGNHKCDIQSDNKILRGQVKNIKKVNFNN
jgi:hypothetical protein